MVLGIGYPQNIHSLLCFPIRFFDMRLLVVFTPLQVLLVYLSAQNKLITC